MTSWPKLVLFDLDGTLIDSVPDIRLAVNELVIRDGYEPFSEDQVRAMVGYGVGRLVQQAYAARGEDLSPQALDGKLEIMSACYMRHLTGRTTPLPGAHEALRSREGRRFALVTNKMQTATEAIIDHFGWRGAFSMILGDCGIPLKPAANMLLHVAAKLGVNVQDAVMVGDSAADIESARRAGIASILVAGGYSAVPPASLGADIVIASLLELEAAYDTLANSAHS